MSRPLIMNAIRRGIGLLNISKDTRPFSCLVSLSGSANQNIKPPVEQQKTFIHTGSPLLRKTLPREIKNWPKYNDIVYPPSKPGEPIRPAEVVHHWSNIKYSTKKLWYISLMLRGMSVDEAIKQLSFYERKGGAIVKEILLEAQEMAVRDHNVEFKSNLWIADARAQKAYMIKGMRKCARGRYAQILYRYSHFLVRLREGKPPEHYYAPTEKTGNELMKEYLENLRNRKIRRCL